MTAGSTEPLVRFRDVDCHAQIRGTYTSSRARPEGASRPLQAGTSSKTRFAALREGCGRDQSGCRDARAYERLCGVRGLNEDVHVV